jgi:predicted nucleotidyltransferase
LAPFDYFDLLFSLEEITGRKVDLVVADGIKNYFFLEQVEKEKVRIYEA